MLGTETEFAQFSKIISADNVLLNSPRREVWEQDFPLSPRRMGEEAKASISESIYNLCATIIGAGNIYLNSIYIYIYISYIYIIYRRIISTCCHANCRTRPWYYFDGSWHTFCYLELIYAHRNC